MPSILFHMRVGVEIIKKNPKLDNPQFYLGLIAPDAVNVDGFAPKNIRWDAHIRDKDLDIWQSNILKFYNKNKEKYEQLYLYGYVIHVLTDIVCDRVYGKNIEPLLKKENVEDPFGYYTKEIAKYENSQIEEEWWKNVVENLKSSKSENINGIESTKIDRWKDYTIKKYQNRPRESSTLITDEYVIKIAKMVEQILNI